MIVYFRHLRVALCASGQPSVVAARHNRRLVLPSVVGARVCVVSLLSGSLDALISVTDASMLLIPLLVRPVVARPSVRLSLGPF